ncbi:MAG: H-NS histone family protein [Magnetococcus sp. YQC-5]
MAREKKTEAAATVAPKPAVEQIQASSAYADMPLNELLNLKDELEKLIKQKQKEQKKGLFAQMSEMAKAAGFSSVEEFLSSQGGRGRAPRADKGVKMPPKYQIGLWTNGYRHLPAVGV